MGWDDEHMYAFVIEDEEYGNPKHGSDADYDSCFVRLSEVVAEGHTRFRYDYDFGDDWGHVVEVEKFDLDDVNEELRYLRRWLGKRRGKHASQAAFAKGDLVRVKPGIVHDLYPDIPLGGWVGKIERVGWRPT